MSSKMANEEQTVIFFVTYNGVEQGFELPEYDLVEHLKLRIFEKFDIPPDKQIINGWRNIPNTDNTILQFCGDVCTVTYLSVECLDEKNGGSKSESERKYFEESTVAEDDIHAAISGFEKLRNNITFDVTINVVPLNEAIENCCFTEIQEHKVLLLYLHNEKDNFSKLFRNNVNTTKVSQILKNNFFVLAWDIENTQFHAAMINALEEFELSHLSSMVRCQVCCIFLIQNIDGCIAVNSVLTGKMSDKDFLSALENVSSILVNEKTQEIELQKLEKKIGNSNDITSRRYQKLMADMLGDRDYDCFEFDQQQELKNKIGYALFGPPSEETGYDQKQKSEIGKIFHSIIENNNKISEFRDRVEISFIYNCTEPLPSEKISRSKKYPDYNPNVDISPVPIFVIRKCRESSRPCRIFIDNIGRVYESWEQYINKNKLNECKMVLPRDGRYEIDVNNEVMLETHLSPACGLDIKILKGADIVSTGAGLVSGGIFLASMIPAVTLAPAILVTAGAVGAGTGLYAIGRSIYNLVDRSKHRETLSFANSEARGAYLNIVAGSLGFVGAGATMAVSQFAARGVNIGQGAGALMNTLSVANIGASGASLINSTYDVIDQWINEDQRPSLLTIVQLSSSILFFGNAVYNFRTCSTIVEETQARALKDYQDSLRSNRHRKTFNKMMKETIRQNDGNQARGRAEVISAIRKIPNKDEVFAALTRSNKDMNKNGVKFYANGGEITLNGQPIDFNKFSTMNKSATSAFLSKLPIKSDVSINEVTSMENVFSKVDITMPDIEVVAGYAVRLLGSYNGNVQALVITALKDLLAFLAVCFQETLNQIFPNASKCYNLLHMVVEFFGGVAVKLASENKVGDMSGKDRYVWLFEMAVNACFSGGHLSDVAMKELIDFFHNWLAQQVYDFQSRTETERSSRVHSGRPRVRAYCSICQGCFFKDS